MLPDLSPALLREILQRSGEHLLLVAVAVALALAIALGLGVAIRERPRLARLVLGGASAVQTIPSLAIFGLLLTVPLLGGIGPTPAVVALTLYALLPLLRGLISGLRQVPPGLVEAGRALGLRPRQVLWHLQLPLALPSLMAGLRVATVTAVGVATIAAAIGAGGLGVFIFRGIATVNNTLLLAGALPAAAIALAADALLGALEKRWVAGAVPRRRRAWRDGPLVLGRLGVAAALLAGLLSALLVGLHSGLVSGLLSGFPTGLPLRPTAADTVVIGAKGFTEQQILGELLAQEIEAHTPLRVRREFSLGSTSLLHQALRSGRLDGYVEYTGTAWTAILGQPPLPPERRQEVWRRSQQLYRERFALRLFPSLGFENTFALLVRRADAERLGLRRISDLERAPLHWRPAFGYEFLNRPDGFPGLARRYGLRFTTAPIAMDLGLTYRALADRQVDLIAGDSTNGLIAALQLQRLEDDRAYFPPYDAVPVFRAETLRRHPELVPLLDGLAGRLSVATMQRLNAAVDLQRQTPAAVVRRWREDRPVRAGRAPLLPATPGPEPPVLP